MQKKKGNKMKCLILILAVMFFSCNNPVENKIETDKVENKICFQTDNYITYCDSIEYDIINDQLIIHQTPCGQVIPEFSKFINSNKFKIK